MRSGFSDKLIASASRNESSCSSRGVSIGSPDGLSGAGKIVASSGHTGQDRFNCI